MEPGKKKKERIRFHKKKKNETFKLILKTTFFFSYIADWIHFSNVFSRKEELSVPEKIAARVYKVYSLASDNKRNRILWEVSLCLNAAAHGS